MGYDKWSILGSFFNWKPIKKRHPEDHVDHFFLKFWVASFAENVSLQVIKITRISVKSRIFPSHQIFQNQNFPSLLFHAGGVSHNNNRCPIILYGTSSAIFHSNLSFKETLDIKFWKKILRISDRCVENRKCCREFVLTQSRQKWRATTNAYTSPQMVRLSQGWQRGWGLPSASVAPKHSSHNFLVRSRQGSTLSQGKDCAPPL